MCTAGLTVGDHTMYTTLYDALSAEYEADARNLASRDSVGRDGIMKAVRELHHQLSGYSKNWSNARHVIHATFAGGGRGCRRNVGGGGAHGKGGGRGKEKGRRRGQQGRGGKGTNEDGGGSAVFAGGDGNSAKAAEGSTSEVRYYTCSKKGHWRVDCTEEPCTDGGTLLMSAPLEKRKLCWRCRTTIILMIRSRLQL